MVMNGFLKLCKILAFIFAARCERFDGWYFWHKSVIAIIVREFPFLLRLLNLLLDLFHGAGEFCAGAGVAVDAGPDAPPELLILVCARYLPCDDCYVRYGVQ